MPFSNAKNLGGSFVWIGWRVIRTWFLTVQPPSNLFGDSLARFDISRSRKCSDIAEEETWIIEVLWPQVRMWIHERRLVCTAWSAVWSRQALDHLIPSHYLPQVSHVHFASWFHCFDAFRRNFLLDIQYYLMQLWSGRSTTRRHIFGGGRNQPILRRWQLKYQLWPSRKVNNISFMGMLQISVWVWLKRIFYWSSTRRCSWKSCKVGVLIIHWHDSELKRVSASIG